MAIVGSSLFLFSFPAVLIFIEWLLCAGNDPNCILGIKNSELQEKPNLSLPPRSLKPRGGKRHVFRNEQLIVGNLASFFKTTEVKFDKKVSKDETMREVGSK